MCEGGKRAVYAQGIQLTRSPVSSYTRPDWTVEPDHISILCVECEAKRRPGAHRGTVYCSREERGSAVS